jgi:cell division protein FtsI (penicillin-binding protein 3)
VKPDTVIPTPGALLIDGTRFEDVESHPSEMTVADILRESSNVGTITIAKQLGKVQFDAAVRNFGFGRVTGLDFPGEAPGIIMPLANYNDTSMASMPIGNGLAVTALQMLDVYVTLANNGVSRQPRLLAATIDADGTRHSLPLGTTRPVVSPETAKMMRDMLTGVVEGGTGVNAQVPGYTVAGKTGTARKPPYDHPPYRYVSSFVGFAPAENARLAAIVVMDEPAKGFFASTAAAPVFSRIMQHALAVERVTATPNSAGTVTGSP